MREPFEGVPRRPIDGRQFTQEEMAELLKLTDEDRRKLAEYFPDEWATPPWHDTAGLLDTDVTQLAKTSLLPRADGLNLMYPATHSTIYGAPGSGKTMLTKYATAHAIDDGLRVLHVDIDGNNAATIAQDVHTIGATRADLIARYRIAQPADYTELGVLITEALKDPFDLVILDSVASLEAYTSTDGDRSSDYVQRVYMPIIRRFLDTGAAVITVDHTGKNEVRGAAGTVQKLAKADIALHVVPGLHQFARGKHGQATVYVDKDRYGTVKAGAVERDGRYVAAIFKIPADGLVRATLEAPADVVMPVEPSQAPVSTRTAVLGVIQRGGRLSRTQVLQRVTASRDAVNRALQRLVEDNELVTDGDYFQITEK